MNFERMVKGIKVTVDYRTELCGVIMLIGEYSEKYPDLFREYNNKSYKEEIYKRFKKYKNHKTIKIFDMLVQKHYFNYDAPITLFLELDEKLRCNELSDYILDDRLSRDETVYEFIESLNDFVEDTNFNDFYRSNEKRYSQYIDGMCDCLKEFDVTEFINRFYGVPTMKLVINLMPFHTHANYGPTVKDTMYANICVYLPNGVKLVEPTFNGGRKTAQLLIHEFGHSYINPLTDKCYSSDDLNVFDDIWENMRKICYPDNKTILNEHIIRACEVVYINEHDKELAKSVRKSDRDLGFVYIDDFIDMLNVYKLSRDEFPEIKDYYQIMVDKFLKEIIKK
ncbi:DUF4932 domain-containing protein [Mycoplasmatota bacterium WC44]